MIFAPQALVDIEQSIDYLADNAGEDVALRFTSELFAKLEWLALSGTTGVSRSLLSPNLRMLLFKSYCIYFRVTDDECRIVRFLNARRDISRQNFADDEG